MYSYNILCILETGTCQIYFRLFRLFRRRLRQCRDRDAISAQTSMRVQHQHSIPLRRESFGLRVCFADSGTKDPSIGSREMGRASRILKSKHHCRSSFLCVRPSECLLDGRKANNSQSLFEISSCRECEPTSSRDRALSLLVT